MGNQDGVQGPSLGAVIGALSERITTLERLQGPKTALKFEDLANAGGRVQATAGQAWVYDAVYARWKPGTVAAGSSKPNLAFGQSGTLTASTSPPLPIPVAATIDGASFALGTAGSTNTVVTIYKNGVSAFTVTITASSTAVFTVTGQAIAAAQYDKITAGVTTVGTGAKDLGGFVHTI